MLFGDQFDIHLPSYLTDPDKDRLKSALNQFKNREDIKDIDYRHFYKHHGYHYFLQADLLREIRVAEWNEEEAQFTKEYTKAIILSNSCDINPNNEQKYNGKECLFAPIIDLNTYFELLEEQEVYSQEQIGNFKESILKQHISNIFYLPKNSVDQREYIVLFDKVFWFPTQELNSYIENIKETRILSLDQFGYYLFVLKLSYHLCRLPEEQDRENDAA